MCNVSSLMHDVGIELRWVVLTGSMWCEATNFKQPSSQAHLNVLLCCIIASKCIHNVSGRSKITFTTRLLMGHGIVRCSKGTMLPLELDVHLVGLFGLEPVSLWEQEVQQDMLHGHVQEVACRCPTPCPTLTRRQLVSNMYRSHIAKVSAENK